METDADDRSADRRMLILETSFDTFFPMLATRTDLAELKGEIFTKLAETRAELRADIRAESARLSRWMATMALSMALGFGSMIVAMFTLLRP